jgi:methionyl-tRNA formyltransferase
MGYCVLHQVDPGIDTGNIVAIKEFQYPVSCRVPNDYLEFAIQQDFLFLQDFITKVEGGNQFALLSQPEYLSTYWPRLHTKTHGYIDWSWKLHHIESFICAFDIPYPGASTFLQNRKVRLRKVATSVSDGVFHPFQSGLIYRKSSEFLYVAIEYGTIIVGEVIDDETEATITQQIAVGERFYTPTECLGDALQYRAIYTAQGLKT